MSMRAFLIVNEQAGEDGIDGIQIAELCRLFAADGLDITIVRPKISEEAGELTRSAIGRGFGMIVVVGGDGTVKAVAGSLINQPIPLAIIPLGKKNTIARRLNLPLNSEIAGSIVTRGKPAETNIGLVNLQPFFTNIILGVGIPVKSNPIPSRPHGIMGTIRGILTSLTFFTGKGTLSAQITIDNQKQRIRFYGVEISINNIDHSKSPFTVTITRPPSPWKQLRYFWSDRRSQISLKPRVSTYHVHRVHISGKTNAIIDGERNSELPISIVNWPGALQVVQPDPLWRMIPSNWTPVARFLKQAIPSRVL
jgi:diacylglycerol kinase family enzyme